MFTDLSYVFRQCTPEEPDEFLGDIVAIVAENNVGLTQIYR